MPADSRISTPRVIAKYAMLAWRSLRSDGISEGVRRCFAEWSFDRRHGLGAWLPREVGQDIREPGFRLADAVQYQGVDPRLAQTVLAALPRDICRQATFVDYGCGKARGLAVGILAGFRRLIGVEVCRDLATVAERNLTTLLARYPEVMVEIRTQDAAVFDPPDGPLVAFLYNPFVGLTLERVVQRLERHATRWPVWVVYINARGAPAFLHRGFRQRAAWGLNQAILLESSRGFPSRPSSGCQELESMSQA
jgi:predicted RNA methylase